MVFRILKESINSTKDDFSVNFSSSSIFQFSAYILSLDCQEYNCSSRDLDMSRGTKKGWMAAKKYVKHLYLKWLIGL